MEVVILDLATLGAIASIAVLCALGVVVLPWTDRELRESLQAMRAIPQLVEPLLRTGAAALGSGGSELRARRPVLVRR